jgi:hypothetical protein
VIFCIGSMRPAIHHASVRAISGKQKWLQYPSRAAFTPEDVALRRGTGWLLIGIYITCIAACRQVFYHWGIPIPLHAVSQLGNVVAFAFIVGGACSLFRSTPLLARYHRSHRIKVFLWLSLLPILVAYGFALGNDWKLIVTEAMGFSYMGVFLLLCGDDRILASLEKHLTVLFYVGVLLNLLYYKTPAVLVGPDDVAYGLNEISDRFTNTLGYSFRPMLGAGFLLGVWGFVLGRRGAWRYLQCLALPVLFVCETGLYKFRSEGAFILLTCLSVLLVRPILQRRFSAAPAVLLGFIIVCGGAYYATTESWQLVERRAFQDTRANPLMAARTAELSAFWMDMGWRILVGNGLGGTFDAYDVFHSESPISRQWPTLHFGVLVLLLKGGIVFLLIFLSILWPCFSLRNMSWFRNPYNLTAALLLPIYLLKLSLIPLNPLPVCLLLHLPAMFVLSRFATRTADVGHVRHK